MNIQEKSLDDICKKLKISIHDKEYYKFKKLVTVVNQAYLKVALKEFENIKKNNPKKNITSNFDFLINLYNKHLREHQVMFLLFNLFETAIRSKAAVELSLKYSSNGNDDWLHNNTLTPIKIQRPLNEAKKKISQDGENINNLDSFEIFDYIMLGQLQSIYTDFWSDLSHLFQTKTIDGIIFNQIGKTKFKRLFDEIRKARNDNAHHKPFHKTRKRRYEIIEDIELILIHIDFNLNQAINNIDPKHKIIRLKYS
ncbi:MAG: hypothetical protein ACNI28_09245 [Arcobacter sp.]|uniref:hypothetical protein n=1 Tax=Arcobacter sp. TaxID=1872629 RepID=UPI003AFF8FC1